VVYVKSLSLKIKLSLAPVLYRNPIFWIFKTPFLCACAADKNEEKKTTINKYFIVGVIQNAVFLKFRKLKKCALKV
jgi:hypothetical protein